MTNFVFTDASPTDRSAGINISVNPTRVAGAVLRRLLLSVHPSFLSADRNPVDRNHFSTGQYSYKEAVIDELATASVKEYVTKISVQVFRT